MSNSDFRRPLLQSGVLLAVIIVFFLFVVSSAADGLISGILAILSGIFSSIVFVIGLVFSIVFSIILLVSLFLGAVALTSVEKAKEFSRQLLITLHELWIITTTYLTRQKIRYLESTNTQSTEIFRLNSEISDLRERNRQLQESLDKIQSSSSSHQTSHVSKTLD